MTLKTNSGQIHAMQVTADSVACGKINRFFTQAIVGSRINSSGLIIDDGIRFEDQQTVEFLLIRGTSPRHSEVDKEVMMSEKQWKGVWKERRAFTSQVKNQMGSCASIKSCKEIYIWTSAIICQQLRRLCNAENMIRISAIGLNWR